MYPHSQELNVFFLTNSLFFKLFLNIYPTSEKRDILSAPTVMHATVGWIDFILNISKTFKHLDLNVFFVLHCKGSSIGENRHFSHQNCTGEHTVWWHHANFLWEIDPPYCAPKVPKIVIFCVNLEHITKFINVFCKCRVLVEFGTE